MGKETDHRGLVVLKALDRLDRDRAISGPVIPVDEVVNYLSACGYPDLVQVRELNERGEGMMGDDRRPLGSILGGLEIIRAVEISRRPDEVTQRGVAITNQGRTLLRIIDGSSPSVMTVLRELPRNLGLLLAW